MSKATRHAPIPSPSRRFRKPAGALLAIIFLGILLLTQPAYCPWGGIVFEALGLMLVALGVFGRLWCALYIAGYKDSTLRVDGPYSICRNPLYFFSFLGLVGVMLYSRIWELALIAGVLFKVYYHFVIKTEQAFLKETYGQAYADYTRRTPCFFPKLTLYHSPREITVLPEKVLGVAKDVLWFFVAAAFVGILHHLHGLGVLPVYWTWPF